MILFLNRKTEVANILSLNKYYKELFEVHSVCQVLDVQVLNRSLTEHIICNLKRNVYRADCTAKMICD